MTGPSSALPGALSLLLVQGSESDAAHILAAVGRPGRAITSERVESSEALLGALERRAWDVVIANGGMPGLCPAETAGAVRSAGLDVPVIITAERFAEDEIPQAMRAGCVDCIAHGSLARLALAVDREVTAARDRAARRESAAVETAAAGVLLAVAEAAGEAAWTATADTLRFTWAHPSIERLVGRTPAEITAFTLGEVLRPAGASRVLGLLSEWQKAAAGSGPPGRPRVDAVPLVGPGGSVVMVEMALALRDHPVTGAREITGVFRDSTEHDLHEAQRANLRKMEAVARLAGGITHDFNNLLQVVQGYGRLARDQVPADSVARAHLDEILGSADRARSLVTRLLAFSLRGRAPRDPVELDVMLEQGAAMLRRLLGDAYLVTCGTDGTPTIVTADPLELEQVLVDLALNAREAMPAGGTVRLALSRTRLDAAFCRTNPWARPGDFAVISVTDAGRGMAPESLEHLFEPFYSTKPHGKATGLGLTSVYGITRRHAGFLNVQSAPGRGTTVAVYLPLARPLASLDAPAPGPRLPRGGTETILLAEDDESVRGFTLRVLQAAGYSVRAAVDGAEAVQLFETDGDTVDLAIIDVILPGLSGTAVADRLRTARPGLPVLFSTGDAFHLQEEGFVPSASTEVIRKPFSHAELLRRVRDMIDVSR
jgi:signal transduction histidine kinase